MGLFDKKYCDVCGEKIGLLGNRKLEDGNLCKACASKLSPWFSERRHSTLEEIKEQLQYREDNKAAVAAFHVTRTLGKSTKVLLDEDARKFVVTSARDLAEANPDVLDYSQVTGCNLDVREHRSEIMKKEGDQQVSYNPKKYEHSYDFYFTINVNQPYFDEMTFKLNSSSVQTGEIPGARSSNPDYKEYLQLGEEIKAALMSARQEVRDTVAEQNKPKVAVKCPQCGATTLPDANGRCEYCGGVVEQ